MANIKMGDLKTMRKAAAALSADAREASKYALEHHANYGPAIKACENARAAWYALQLKAHAYIELLAGDPETDQSWFPYLAEYEGTATAVVAEMFELRKALFLDMATHFTLTPAEIEASPFDAAAAVDAAAKTPPVLSPHLPPMTPNVQDPNNQDPKHPPAEPPPVEEGAASPWMIAGALALGAIALKLIFG
jgi:hypothetical protein